MAVRTVERTWRTDGSESADGQSIAVAVIEAISELTDEDSPENEPTLYEHIDPDALDSMLAHARSNTAANWEVQFDTDAYTVTVTSDGRITVN